MTITIDVKNIDREAIALIFDNLSGAMTDNELFKHYELATGKDLLKENANDNKTARDYYILGNTLFNKFYKQYKKHK